MPFEGFVISKWRSRMKQVLMLLLYWGWRHRCPICGGNFREWLNCGLEHRRKGKCPRCSSVERHRLIILYLKNKTDFFKSPLKVLHVAPEFCFVKMFKNAKNLEYQTADLNSLYADIHVDITNMAIIPDNSYDVVLCSHVLEHIQEDLKAMREIRRILKPNGWAILQVPIRKGTKTFEDPSVISSEMRRKLFGQEDHVRMYGDDYKNRLESAGFKVMIDSYAAVLGEAQAKKFGLDLSEDICFCTK